MATIDASSQPGWLLDELAFAGRENLDAEHVARYDGKEDAGAVEEIVYLRQFGLDESFVVVDLGAGTGQFALEVAPVCARVVAVDVSPVMLSLLRDKIADRGLTNVDVRQAGFLTYEQAGDPADLVYSRYALHHVPDAWKAVAFAHIHRMLKPGGLLRLWDVVYNFEPDDALRGFEAWCSTGADRIVGEWGRWELEEHIREEYSTFTWLLEPMMERAGFAIEDATYSEDGIFAKYLLRA